MASLPLFYALPRRIRTHLSTHFFYWVEISTR